MRKIILGLVIVIFLIGGVAAIDDTTSGVTSCCEKTTAGAWCQNAPEAQCDTTFRNVPTSCDSTSYCRMGTCYNQREGTCIENTPQKTCEDNGGLWAEGDSDDVPQCSLACCLIGDQAAFVTQTRCKRLSNLYGLEINFRSDITDEVSCIQSAISDEEGACVFEQDFEKTCVKMTRRECNEFSAAGENGTSEVTFHAEFLCSAEQLGTDCSRTQKTTCIEGRDEVFFVDSCGNIANVYDAAMVDDVEYWSKIKDKSEVCGFGSSNADSSSCGSCDYYLGSTCKAYKRGTDVVRPTYGDSICRDLACEWEGETYEHGETWCANSEGIEEKENESGVLPGSRYFRAVCYNNEVSVEPCADFRQEVCIESEVNGFAAAGCVVNKWQDCSLQIEKKDCNNIDRRDCRWIDKIELSNGGDYGTLKTDGACVPSISPGLNFWEAAEDATQSCNVASTKCTVTYETGLTGGEECVDNCECLADEWRDELMGACVSLGDCGYSTNFIGVEGYNNDSKEAFVTEDVDEEDEDSGGLLGGLF
jgi:hypothetical protein